jgi:hypothetical protein
MLKPAPGPAPKGGPWRPSCLATILAKNDPELVLETVESGAWWPDQWITAREAVLRVSEFDLQRAVDHFVDVDAGKQHREVAYRFASRLADEGDSQAALTFADELEQPIAKVYAVRAAVTFCVEENSVAASTYVNGLAEPEVRDHAILGLIDAIWISNPQDSATWAQSMTDAELRTETMIRLANAWDRRGESANVDALLNTPGLSANEAQAMREALATAAAEAEARKPSDSKAARDRANSPLAEPLHFP